MGRDLSPEQVGDVVLFVLCWVRRVTAGKWLERGSYERVTTDCAMLVSVLAVIAHENGPTGRACSTPPIPCAYSR
jgi:hypothetical protein